MYSLNADRRGEGITSLLSLDRWHFYPAGDDLVSTFLEQGPSAGLRLTPRTPIGIIGSCFAREMKRWLLARGYNFLQTAVGPCTEAGSARYDRVYNTFTMRQEFERAFGVFEPQETCWQFVMSGKLRLVDPYRKCIAWDDETDMQCELAEHAVAVRRAFTEAELLIVAVGQAEIWYHKNDGYVYPHVPPSQIFDPQQHGFRLSTCEENVANLERVYDLFTKHNASGHILVTLSPVPLRATFRQANSVVANAASKSILRAAIEEFVTRHSERVAYFPAYELVNLLPQPFESDNRHVTQCTVDRIMSLFEAMFVERVAEMAGTAG